MDILKEASATLKQKIQALINIASKGKMLDKCLKNEPYDLVIEDDWTMFFDLMASNMKEQTVKGNIAAEVSFNSVFSDCDQMTSCILPNCVFTGRYAFKNCTALKNVELPAATTAAGYTAAKWQTTFNNCTALENVKLGAGTNLNTYLFYSDNLTQECLIDLIKGFADLTGETAQTFWVGDINKARIPAEYQTMLTHKNWMLK